MSICELSNQIQYIDIDECIGNSLTKITTNFSKTENQICVNAQNIEDIENDFEEFTTKVNTLSANKNRFIKASVVFDGDGPGQRFLNSTFNVSMVSSLSTGTYAIYFTPPLTDNNYALIGQSNLPFLSTTTVTSQSAVINIYNTTKNLTDAKYVSVIVYND